MSDIEVNPELTENPVSGSDSSKEKETSPNPDLLFHLEDTDSGDAPDKNPEIADNQDEMAVVRQELEEWKDKYIRLASEFDNYRKRTQKEKGELIRYANEELIKAVLPVLDDFDRSLVVFEKSDNLSAIQEGVRLIHHKFKNILSAKGLKPMESLNTPFDSDRHEAITSIPAPDESAKGKIVDEVEKGYFLDDKVIRFAKVIVGA